MLRPRRVSNVVLECERCGSRMALIDETTKIVEYRCPNCYTKQVVKKDQS